MPTTNSTQRRWLFSSHSATYTPRATRPLRFERFERLRRVAKLLKLSPVALQHLEWLIYYHTTGEQDVTFTARHFGISRKTLHKWINRFDERNLHALEEQSTRPRTLRQKTYTPTQYERIILLRRAHIRYGKKKLFALYCAQHPEDTTMSEWKTQRIIEQSGIYYNPAQQGRINKKRVRSVKRKKITDLKQKKVSGFLICMDTIVRYWNGEKRYILTGIDRYSKVAFARMYTTHNSSASADFLLRLHYLLDGKIANIQTDNGSEFHKHFDTICQKLNIPHYWSRVHTPKDNAVNERFNRTLQEEFIQLGHATTDTTVFNRHLTEWLVEYNYRRPHQSLDYMPPINFHYKYHKVLPMYPSSTTH